MGYKGQIKNADGSIAGHNPLPYLPYIKEIKTMAKKKISYLRCKQCGKVDFGNKLNYGTQTDMTCQDCTDGSTNKYGMELANMCRDCCPTGHGTHASINNIE